MPSDMETRSRTAGASKPMTMEDLDIAMKQIATERAELDAFQQALKAKQNKVTSEGAALEEQRIAFEKEKAIAMDEIATQRDNFDLLRWGNPPTAEANNKTHDNIDRHDTRATPPLPAQRCEPHYEETGYYPLPSPKVSFREATEGVPTFDGYNVPLLQFTRACRRAREIIPPAAERNLTKLLVNKLTGRAYYAVEDEPCDTVTQLIDLLNGAFGPSKTIDQYRGELSTIYLRPTEHVLDYISRVKDLRSAILDAERRSHGFPDPRFVAEIETLTARSFCDGLPLEYRLQLSPDLYGRPSDAFARVKAIAKRQELDRQRFEPRAHNDRQMQGQSQGNLKSTAQPSPRHYNASYNNSTPRWNRERFKGNHPAFNRTESNRNNNNSNSSWQPRNYQNYREPADTSEISCRYCKNKGHTIEECRKRQYNNAQRNNSGNANGPMGLRGAARSDPRSNTRPVRLITAEEEENQNEDPTATLESQS